MKQRCPECKGPVHMGDHGMDEHSIHGYCDNCKRFCVVEHYWEEQK